MNEKDWTGAYAFTRTYVIVLALLTIVVAVFYIREHTTDVAWQALAGVFLIMVIALFITGWLLKEG